MTHKQKIERIVKSLSVGWLPEERETSILFLHDTNEVLLETTHTYTARRWWELFKDDTEVKFDDRADTLKMVVPASYCRKPELIIKPKHR